MTEIGELVKYNKKLIGSMLVAIEGQEIGKLSLGTIAETLKSMSESPKILTFLVPEFIEKEEEKEEEEDKTHEEDSNTKNTTLTVKNGDEGFICPTCLLRFKNADSLITHVVTSHVTEIEPPQKHWTDMMRSAFTDGLVLPESLYQGSVTALRAALRAIPLPEPSDTDSVSQLVGQLKRLTSTFGVPKIVRFIICLSLSYTTQHTHTHTYSGTSERCSNHKNNSRSYWN